MAIPLVGGVRPVSAALLRTLGLGGGSPFISGDDTNFGTNLGNWTNPWGGTMTRDTGRYAPPGTGVASLKLEMTTGGQYAELPISGKFVAGSKYIATVLLATDLGRNVNINFGLLGTDVGSTSVVVPVLPAASTFGWACYAVEWTPTADRTGVRLQLGNVGPGNFWIGYVRVERSDGIKPLILDNGGSSMRQWTPTLNSLQTGTWFPTSGGGEFHSTGGAVYRDSPWGTAGYDLGSSGDAFIYAEANGTIGDLADGGVNFEVGPDYPGFYISELDSNTIQFVADSPDYMLQLRHRGTGGWSVSNDGIVNAKIDAAFQHTLTVAGALTVATNLSTHFQTPDKAIIDEVRVHVGTAPVGADLIVDVNAGGTTIFTTQSSRPTILDGATDATSGAADGGAAVAKNAVITVDVDQVGSGTAGSDLTVFLRGRYIW